MNNSWGLYPWFPDGNRQDHLVHPDDLEALRALYPYGRLFCCIGKEGDYLILQYRQQTYRVKPDLYRQLPTPKFGFGELVIDPNHPERVCVINHIGWHHVKNCPLFHVVTTQGKRISKRYFEEDLVSIN